MARTATVVAAFFFILLIAAIPGSYAQMPIGYLIEGAPTLPRHAFNLRTGIEGGIKAKPIKISSSITGTSDRTIDVSTLRMPLEMRFGLTDHWELGGDFGIEVDRGGVLIGSDEFLHGSGIQHLRGFGKWNYAGAGSVLFELAFAGDNTLYYGLDSFDLGVKFIFGPKIGRGELRMNLGFLIKGGDIDVGTALKVDYNNIVSFGIGYATAFSERFTGVFELAGATATYKGGTGIAGKNGPLSLLLGGAYHYTDRARMDAALGVGIGKGSPVVFLRAGMDWTWGGGSTGDAPTGARAAKPTDKATVTSPAKPASDEPFYEPPTKYDVPRPVTPAAPAGPTPEEQLKKHMADAAAAYERGEYPQAAGYYQEAIRMKGNDPLTQYNLATCYFLMKKYTDARTYYKNTVTLRPDDADGHFYLGYCYYYLHDPKAAVREWQKVLEIDPTNAQARDNLQSMGAE